MFVIGSGTRHPDHDDCSRVWTALDLLLGWAKAGRERLEVAHGGAPGVDRAMRDWCARAVAAGEPVTEYPHPALWGAFGRSAGRARNRAMWSAHWHRVHLCLTFPAPDSIGTRDCEALARQYGCPLWSNPTGQALTAPPPAHLIPESWSRAYAPVAPPAPPLQEPSP
jgi:hypothetical protein